MARSQEWYVIERKYGDIKTHTLFFLVDEIIEIEHSDSVHDKMADIYAIGFQEIVDLNAQNIMAASSDNAKACRQ